MHLINYSFSKRKKSFAVMLSILVIVVLIVLGIIIYNRSIFELNSVRRSRLSTKALWIAEAGINRALKELRSNFNQSGDGIFGDSFGGGNYSVDIEVIDSNTKKVTSTGSIASGSSSIKRIIEVEIKKYIPGNFYDSPVYCAGNVDINGSSYSITSEDSLEENSAIMYAGSYSVEHPENITGTVTYDSSIAPLARFDFQQLYDTSSSQGNIYDADRLKEVQKGNDSFPSSFWYTRADDGIDNDSDGQTDEADEWVPNVVYVESDLQLNGNIGTIGGFFVVVGDVITDPDETDDAVINGNGTIDGVIYTLGEFRINGGGGNLNVNGGVWAGEEVRINGNASITYESNYMDAIEALDIDPGVYISSWQESVNPYRL